MEMPNIKTLVDRLGGPSRIGEFLNISHSAVCQWERIPHDHCTKLEAWSHTVGPPVKPTTCEQMRPDLYVRLPLAMNKS